MEKPNVILGAVARVDAAPESLAEAGVRGAAGGTLEFENGRTVRFDPQDRRGPALGGIAREMQRLGRPVYVEVSPEDVVTRMLLPTVGRVLALHDEPGGDVRVELDASHAVHVVRREGPDFEPIVRELRAARETGESVAIAETDDHEVVHVAPFRLPPPPRPERLPEPEPRPGLLEMLERWLPFRWLRRLLRCCRCCVSRRRAQELFDQLAARTCDPLTVPSPCIPFLYPDDGCWARAHEMARVLKQQGACPRKVWISGWPLVAPTRNHPSCQVQWGWHVAPTICVRTGLLRCATRVIDPSLFSGPVSRSQWKGAQGNPAATLTDTSADVFHGGHTGNHTTDPTYAQAEADMAFYRQKLKLRSLGPDGPPPYAHC